MKLRALEVLRMPGIADGFAITDIDDGIHLLVGPNGSGKSSWQRAVRGLLWPETLRSERVRLASRWELPGDVRTWTAERDGRVVQWRCDGAPVDPPPLPDTSVAGCFALGLRDLLTEEDETDADIARAVRRLMAGGFDPMEVRDRVFAPRPRAGQSEARALQDWNERVRRERRDQETVANEEAQLDRLGEEHEAARQTTAALSALRRVQALAHKRGALAKVRTEIAQLPSDLERFRGGEQERWQELQAQRQELQQEIETAGARRERAAREAEETRPPHSLQDAATRHTWIARAQALARLATRSAEARQVVVQREAEVAETRARLAAGGAVTAADGAHQEERAPLAALDAADAFLARAERVRATSAALAAEIETLASSENSATEEAEALRAADRETLARGITLLETWRVHHEAPLAGAGSRPLLVLALLALVGGMLLALYVHPVAWGLAGVAVGALAWRAHSMAAANEARGRCRSAFEELSLPAPGAWSTDTVREWQRELEAARAAAVQREQRAARREALGARAAQTKENAALLNEDRRGLRAATGFDLGRSDLKIGVLAREVSAWGQAEQRAAAARADFERCTGEESAARDSLLSFVTNAGLAADDAGAALHQLEQVRDLGERHERARVEQERESRALDALNEKAARLAETIAAFQESLGAATVDERWLEERSALAQTWRDKVAEEKRWIAEIAAEEKELAAFPQWLELDGTELEERATAMEAQADRVGSLREEIGRIRARVQATRQGRTLENALAEREEARRTLEEAREAALFIEAGRFLLDRVSTEHDQRSRPQVVRRAQGLFAKFSRNAYTLETDGSATMLRARETNSGKSRALGELSDGTRIQLLLAVRLAFGQEAERGASAPLPLFLDEVLTTTDPERFHAIAGGLALLAREEGRQIFSLSANPSDAARWRHETKGDKKLRLGVHDLARLRGWKVEEGARAPADLALPAAPELPSPRNASAEEFGAHLGVPPVDLRSDVRALHLFHLLRDDLRLLHRLLRHDVRTVGEWRTVLDVGGEGAAEIVAGKTGVRRVAARVRVAGAFFTAWRVGRGQPVDAEALREAGLRPPMLARVRARLEAVGGDAKLLLADLEAGGVARLQKKKIAELRAYLIEARLLDERAPHGAEQLRAHMLAECADDLQEGALKPEEVADVVRALGGDAALSESISE